MGNEELFFNGYIALVLQDEKLLEMDGNDGHTMMWMYLMPVNCTLKYRQDSKFQVVFISP